MTHIPNDDNFISSLITTAKQYKSGDVIVVKDEARQKTAQAVLKRRFPSKTFRVEVQK